MDDQMWYQSFIVIFQMSRHDGGDGIFIVYFKVYQHWLFPQLCSDHTHLCMMTSSNGKIFRITGHLCKEFSSHQWIPRTKASDTELWCFLWFAPWINGWVNDCKAGDLRGHRAHYGTAIKQRQNRFQQWSAYTHKLICETHHFIDNSKLGFVQILVKWHCLSVIPHKSQYR